jgi:hypothetical protein
MYRIERTARHSRESQRFRKLRIAASRVLQVRKSIYFYIVLREEEAPTRKTAAGGEAAAAQTSELLHRLAQFAAGTRADLGNVLPCALSWEFYFGEASKKRSEESLRSDSDDAVTLHSALSPANPPASPRPRPPRSTPLPRAEETR